MMTQAVVKAALQCEPDCPSLEMLDSAADLAAENPKRHAVEIHLAGCAACRKELALLQEFDRSDVHTEEAEAVEWITARLAATSFLPESNKKVVAVQPKWSPSFWNSASLRGALAVAAVLLFAIWTYFPLHRFQPVIGGGEDTLRSAPLRALAPAGDLTTAPKEFQWSAVNGAANYVLRVTEVDRTLVFETRITTTSLLLPAKIARLLQPGKTLVWRVRAEDSSGREISTSGEQRFRLEP